MSACCGQDQAVASPGKRVPSDKINRKKYFEDRIILSFAFAMDPAGSFQHFGAKPAFLTATRNGSLCPRRRCHFRLYDLIRQLNPYGNHDALRCHRARFRPLLRDMTETMDDDCLAFKRLQTFQRFD